MTFFPTTPFFPDATKVDPAGVDHLALSAVGERLVAAGLPGITNLTRYLRPYSIASWVSWQYSNFEKQSGDNWTSDRVGSSFRAFREKVELAFSWSNHQVTGSIGRRRKYPDTSTPVEMQFDNPIFGPHNHASWFAPAAYGPSFADTAGLGFVTRKASSFAPTTRGIGLARAIDEVLRVKTSAYAKLVSMREHKMSKTDVEALEQGLSLQQITETERRLFADAIYSPSLVGQLDGGLGSRSTSICLLLRCLDCEGQASVEAVRQAMALGISSTGTTINLEGLGPCRQLWFVLALRQLQRIALESLLSWFESTLKDAWQSWCDLNTLVEHAEDVLNGAIGDDALRPLRGFFERIQSSVESAGGPEPGMLNEPAMNVFALRRELQSRKAGDGDFILPRSTYSLVVCAVMVEATRSRPNIAPLFALGGRDRVGLAWFAEFVSRHMDGSVSEFLRDTIKELVYAQHLYTAASRVEEGKNKFRFAMDENGLRLLIPPEKINIQGVTPDRLDSALELLTQCGILIRNGFGEYCKA